MVRRRLHFVRMDPKFDLNNTSILTDSRLSNNEIRFEEFHASRWRLCLRVWCSSAYCRRGPRKPGSMPERCLCFRHVVSGRIVEVLVEQDWQWVTYDWK